MQPKGPEWNEVIICAKQRHHKTISTHLEVLKSYFVGSVNPVLELMETNVQVQVQLEAPGDFCTYVWTSNARDTRTRTHTYTHTDTV
mmetsp:Transcript_23806/g.65435  ORF Transcript_23806/g.65435 Transcript_23806/m.65435 type:complete len:87 (+) Transcript_23806:43-303(+)